MNYQTGKLSSSVKVKAMPPYSMQIPPKFDSVDTLVTYIKMYTETNINNLIYLSRYTFDGFWGTSYKIK